MFLADVSMKKNRGIFCEGPEDIISRIIKNDESLKEAYFDTFPLSISQVKRLAEGIKSNTHLTYLNVFDCQLSHGGVEAIIAALAVNSSIETVIINQDIGEGLYEQVMQAVGNREQHDYAQKPSSAR